VSHGTLQVGECMQDAKTLIGTVLLEATIFVRKYIHRFALLYQRATWENASSSLSLILVLWWL
jgi:hypothetical protein